MTITKYLTQLLSHSVVDWPEDCWSELMSIIHEKGFKGLLEDKANSLACIFTLAAYFMTKLRDDKPIIGSVSTRQEQEIERGTFLLANSAGLPPAMGGIRGLLIQRALAMLVAYAISVAQDSDKVKELFDEAAAWIRQWMEDNGTA